MNKTVIRGVVTVVLWLSYLGIIVYGMDLMGVWVAALAFAMMLPLMVAMGAVWGVFSKDYVQESEEATETEKRKRERLDSVLRDLSDDELLVLRQRLQDGTIDDDILEERIVGDDGELLSNRQNY